MTVRKALRKGLVTEQLIDHWAAWKTDQPLYTPIPRTMFEKIMKGDFWAPIFESLLLICFGSGFISSICLGASFDQKAGFNYIWFSVIFLSLVGVAVSLFFQRFETGGIITRDRFLRDLQELRSEFGLGDDRLKLDLATAEKLAESALIIVVSQITHAESWMDDLKLKMARSLRVNFGIKWLELKKDFERKYEIFSKFKLVVGKDHYFARASTKPQSEVQT